MSRLRDAVLKRRDFLICELTQTKSYKGHRKELIHFPLQTLENEYSLLRKKIG